MRSPSRWLADARAPSGWSQQHSQREACLASLLLPSGHGNNGPFARSGLDVEFVHQPFAATESETHSLFRGVAVSKREFYIGDSRTFIRKGQANSLTATVDGFRDLKFSPPPMLECVPSKFARGGNNLRLIHKTQLQVSRPKPDPLPHKYHIGGIFDGERLSFSHCPRHIPHYFHKWL